MKREDLIKPNVRYPLGFTFSFPCKQEGLASARLTSWTQGFTCSGVVNHDVVKMLQTAIDEKVRARHFPSRRGGSVTDFLIDCF